MGIRILQKLNKYINVMKTYFVKKNGVLVYAGMHKGSGFSSIFRKYEVCYGFEADPELYEQLKIKFGKYPQVKIFNVAVGNYDGEIEFNISSNDGASSSIGNFSQSWENHKSGEIKMIKKIKVPCINLYSFLQKHNIEHIEDYVSDIQGFDLEALKTLKPLIDEKRIKNITSEVTKDSFRNIYDDLPDNSESSFNLFLGDKYKCVAKGWGILTDGQFNEVPDEWWEMDCKWRVVKE